jgi:integrase
MFTKRALEAIKPTGKLFSVKDEKTPGLILMVTPKGAKTFYSYRWLANKPERIKLGTFPAMTIEQARAKAAEVNGAVAKDHNPAEAKRAIRAEPTFAEVFERFLKEKRNRSGKPMSDRNATEYRRVVATHLNGITGRKLSEITPERVKAAAGKVKSPSQANKVKAIISAVFNWARDEGITGQANPAQAIKSKAIPSRERFLLPSEFPQFMRAVEASTLRDFFLLALFTGARRSNLQEMRWQDVNLEEFTWTIPKTKNGDPQTIALPPEAVEIIKARRAEAIVGAAYVFPGRGKSGHLVEPKKAWDQILEAAGLENLRIHDLRRTLGSWQARQGASLTVIGKSLGHRSQQATAIYSRLDLDPVRASVEMATAAMVEAGKLNSEEITPDPEPATGNVLPFRPRTSLKST